MEEHEPDLPDRYGEMLRAIHAEIRDLSADDPDYQGWGEWAERFLGAHLGEEPAEKVIELGYRQVLLRHDARAQRNLSPETPDDWKRMLVFNSPEDVRARAQSDRH
jgi:hypothetical protein